MITRKLLEDRLASLKASEQNVINNLNAYVGAIQECEFWLKQLDTPQAEAAPSSDP